jgi:hypothetical protein
MPLSLTTSSSLFIGRRGLSGGAACHWYIYEDLPEINDLRDRLVPRLQPRDLFASFSICPSVVRKVDYVLAPFFGCRLQDKVPVVQGISLPGQTAAEISAQVDLETKTVKELVDINIWENAVRVYGAIVCLLFLFVFKDSYLCLYLAENQVLLYCHHHKA